MTVGQLLSALTFERAYKIVVMSGAVISAVSCVAIALMLAPSRPSTAPAEDAPSELSWTAAPVRISPEMRERQAARREAARPAAPAAPSPAAEPARVEAAALPALPQPERVAAATPEQAAMPASAPATIEAPQQQEPQLSDSPEPGRAVYHSPEVIDGGTLWVDGRFIRLAGIEPLAADDVCEAGRRRVWRCGQRARAVLRNLVRRQRVECTAVGGGDATLARCTVSGKDLSQTLIAQHLAIPLGAATARNDDPPPFYPFGRRHDLME